MHRPLENGELMRERVDGARCHRQGVTSGDRSHNEAARRATSSGLVHRRWLRSTSSLASSRSTRPVEGTSTTATSVPHSVSVDKTLTGSRPAGHQASSIRRAPRSRVVRRCRGRRGAVRLGRRLPVGRRLPTLTMVSKSRRSHASENPTRTGGGTERVERSLAARVGGELLEPFPTAKLLEVGFLLWGQATYQPPSLSWTKARSSKTRRSSGLSHSG